MSKDLMKMTLAAAVIIIATIIGRGYFVMGDNRDNSEDSRYWGFVPTEAVKGRPLIIYFSYDRNKLAPFPWLTEIRWNRLLDAIR